MNLRYYLTLSPARARFYLERTILRVPPAAGHNFGMVLLPLHSLTHAIYVKQ